MAECNEQDLIAAEKRRCAALIGRELEVLSDLLADDLIFVHTNALVETKSDLLAGQASGNTRYLNLDHSHLRSRIVGPIGIITALVDMVLQHSHRPQETHLQIRMIGNWHFQAGKWRLLAYQSTRVPGT